MKINNKVIKIDIKIKWRGILGISDMTFKVGSGNELYRSIEV